MFVGTHVLLFGVIETVTVQVSFPGAHHNFFKHILLSVCVILENGCSQMYLLPCSLQQHKCYILSDAEKVSMAPANRNLKTGRSSRPNLRQNRLQARRIRRGNESHCLGVKGTIPQEGVTVTIVCVRCKPEHVSL